MCPWSRRHSSASIPRSSPASSSEGAESPTRFPPNAVATYGMTETGSGVVYDGWPLDGVELSFRPAQAADPGPQPGADGGADAEGEILIRAPMLLRCYRGADDDGRVAGPDGSRDWFATGDAGHLDGDGKLAVSGRIADVITTGAEKVWPDQVERVLIAHPGIAEVAIWKRPRSGMGRAGGGLGRSRRRWSLARRAPPDGHRGHRSVGGPQGARPRRRPSPDRGRQGPTAGARALD